jgi:5'-AMP-activated protein kinase, regulatory gamma subunit
MATTVFDVVHMFSERGISAVPILDKHGVVIDLYETVDVIVSLACFIALYMLTSDIRPLFVLELTIR